MLSIFANFSGKSTACLRTTEGDIAVLGSRIQGGDLFFDSAKGLRVESLQDRFIQRSENKNSGWQLGGFIGGSGNSYGIGIEG